MIDPRPGVLHFRNGTGASAACALLKMPDGINDIVVTAAHMVYSSGVGTRPAGVLAPFDASPDLSSFTPATLIDYNPITDWPLVTITQAGLDFALLKLDKPLPGLPTFGLFPAWGGGTATATGFPGGTQASADAAGFCQKAPGIPSDAVNAAYQTPYLAPGMSGGPLWIADSATAWIAGVVSNHQDQTYGVCCALTRNVVDRIEDVLMRMGRSPRVGRLYRCVFNRAPDAKGLAWASAIEALYGLAAVAQSFMASPEYAADFGNASAAACVELIYSRALSRPSDPGGLAYWAALPPTWALAGIVKSTEAIINSARS